MAAECLFLWQDVAGAWVACLAMRSLWSLAAPLWLSAAGLAATCALGSALLTHCGPGSGAPRRPSSLAWQRPEELGRAVGDEQEPNRPHGVLDDRRRGLAERRNSSSSWGFLIHGHDPGRGRSWVEAS